ncbi:uncharacterized protein B0P05DRAFT_548594, partial [Gilbertella persicaria]|uniref:uncharacterized protein n=1 Tax=Gilbertella persicaria TaxID=101096 RepID=UPI002220163C
MDLSWCIMCDNRIVDDELSMADDNSLYCSQECKLKDEQATTKPTLKSWMTKKSTAKHHFYRTSAPTSTYPWIPLYQKRRSSIQSKRCTQPITNTKTSGASLIH